mmetsp:Transcript_42248/g.69623  ORF Transcript_42248/g.69623 Transcript_42248/m.69623 type:complete len:207 (+) Transcript_42248:873-1493(+)
MSEGIEITRPWSSNVASARPDTLSGVVAFRCKGGGGAPVDNLPPSFLCVRFFSLYAGISSAFFSDWTRLRVRCFLLLLLLLLLFFATFFSDFSATMSDCCFLLRLMLLLGRVLPVFALGRLCFSTSSFRALLGLSLDMFSAVDLTELRAFLPLVLLRAPVLVLVVFALTLLFLAPDFAVLLFILFLAPFLVVFDLVCDIVDVQLFG